MGLWIVTRALWPLLIRFIDKMEKRLDDALAQAALERQKSEESAKVHYQWAQGVVAQFSEAIGKYNESNAETVRQLQKLAEHMEKGKR